MNGPLLPLMSIEQFFTWAEKYPERVELVYGTPRMLEYGTFQHSRLKTSVLLRLVNELDQSQFDVAVGNFALQTGPQSIRFPDIMVLPFSTDGQAIFANNPLVVVEILSSTTMSEDFGPKQFEYLALPSLQAYLIVSQDQACVWAWIRDENGFAEKPEVIETLDATMTINALDLSLPMRAIYRHVDL